MQKRKARFSGSWYTSDPVMLRAEIDEFLEMVHQDIWGGGLSQKDRPAAERIPAEPVKGGMLPHAGLYFSGRGIAHFFHALSAETDRIIIIAPSHYVPLLPDTIFGSSFDAFDTPIGSVRSAGLLSENGGKKIREHNQAVELEHAVEMFLPFIARVQEASGQSITADLLLVSEITSLEHLESLTDTLITLLGKDQLASGKTALIASSDYTHYGPRFAYTPFGSENVREIEQQVEQQDRSVAGSFCAYQFRQLLEMKDHQDLTICGFAPGLLTASCMKAVGARGEVIDYYNSNRFVGPDTGFVAYCTILWR